MFANEPEALSMLQRISARNQMFSFHASMELKRPAGTNARRPYCDHMPDCSILARMAAVSARVAARSGASLFAWSPVNSPACES